jgi:mono/diheme cytochrome c family protein
MTSSRSYLLIPIAGSLLLLGAVKYPQQEQEYEAPTYLIESLEGRDLFRAYCAACHGSDARGGGPAAASLKTKLPDLTRIAQRRGGVFPLLAVERTIAGEQSETETHGKREMPIWGPILSQIQRDRDLGRVRIRNLAKYLESLQEPKPVPPPESNR